MITRLQDWIQSILKRIWLPLLLSTSTVLVIYTALNKSQWFTGTQVSLVWMLFFGFLLGILLARTRFPGWLAAGFSLLLSTAGVVQNGMGIIQPFLLISELSFPTYLNLTHLRTLAFLGQISTWFNAFFETGEFVSPLASLLTGFAIWNLCTWMAWWGLHQRKAITGMLPMGFFITLHVQQHWQNINIALGFLASMLLLVAYMEFHNRKNAWEKKNVDYPMDFGFDWPASAVAFVVLLVFLGSIAPIIGTKEGHQKIVDFFTPEEETPPAQEYSPPSFGKQVAYTADLVVDFSPPTATQHTVMWVSVSDPPPPQTDMVPLEAIEQYYWRSEIFTTYTGKNWQSADILPVENESLPQTEALPGRRQIDQTFEILLPHGNALFAINQPTNAEPANLLHILSNDESLVPSGDTSTYQVTSWLADLDSQKLREVDYRTTPQNIQDTYLQIPEDLPQRVVDLAKGLTNQSETRFEKTMRIQDYLRRTYLYDLNTPPPPTDQDIVDYFLFDAPSGFCSHYASSMVVMLRSVGVPSRLVTGYVHGDYYPSRNAYRVPASAAHAWVEVYFPVYGWIEFEPTPTRPSHRYENLNQFEPEDKPARTNARSQRNPIIYWLPISLVVAGMVALISFRAVIARQKRKSISQINTYYNQTQQYFTQMGIAADPGTTPNEYLVHVQDTLKANNPMLFAFTKLTDFYIHENFNPRPLDAGQIKQAKQYYKLAKLEWRKWKLRLLLRPKSSRTKAKIT